ncbi:MAG: NUDIX domain-containing protein [Planctomycetes bacterium]|nr:NUDIX domain-containing protein [Planctomycetota bacterium]
MAIIERAGRYLMIRRPDDIRAGGYWCFVGGGIEDGESQEQALVREVREEVGLEVVPGEKVWECLSIYKEWVLHCWTVRDSGGEVQADPREVAEHRWLTVAEIMRLPKLMPSVPEFFRYRGLL